jgi:hypothetical protein
MLLYILFHDYGNDMFSFVATTAGMNDTGG